jgi:hypothetical protein
MDGMNGCPTCATTIGRAGCPTHRDPPPVVNSYITTCIHGTDLRFTPRCYLCRPDEPLAFIASPDNTDLLLLIADCLVTLAWKAEPDAGARRSRFEVLRAALEADR